MTISVKHMRGGARPGSGPKVKSDADRMISISLRMRPAQAIKLHDLGGAKWIRDRIDTAKVPT